jgi:hypothetical protein
VRLGCTLKLFFDLLQCNSSRMPNLDIWILEVAAALSVLALMPPMPQVGTWTLPERPRLLFSLHRWESGRRLLRHLINQTDFGYFFPPRIASLAALATRNFTTRLAETLMVWPFLGPNCIVIVRAGRFTNTSLPMPGTVKVFLACL